MPIRVDKLDTFGAGDDDETRRLQACQGLTTGDYTKSERGDLQNQRQNWIVLQGTGNPVKDKQALGCDSRGGKKSRKSKKVRKSRRKSKKQKKSRKSRK